MLNVDMISRKRNNIDSFKDFKKEFAKANIADSYWKDANNLSFMEHVNAYVAQLIALYQLALTEYIKVNKDTLDEIQAKMTLHPIVTLPDL